MMNSPYPTYEDVLRVRELFREASHDHWIHDDLFSWKRWLLLALTIIPWILLALFCTLVGEPLFMWLRFYIPHTWKLIYSFAFYILTAMLCRWVIFVTQRSQSSL